MAREVSVIIPTAARDERAASLLRAIDGLFASAPVPEVIVVVNGNTYDRPLLGRLRADRRLRVEYQEIGSYPAAQRRGRELVQTEFFCFLDDDDELLEGSIARRLERMRHSDTPDVVVSGGVREENGVDVICRQQLPADGDDLMLDLLGENWFASPAPLFRSKSVGPEFFDGNTKYFEWTLMGFAMLNANRRFAFVLAPGYRLHDSPSSLSKDPASALFAPLFLRRLLTFEMSPAARDRLHRRLAAAHHNCADLEIAAGQPIGAWRHHLRSLLLPGGLAYLPFTRRLVVPTLRSRRKTSDSRVA